MQLPLQINHAQDQRIVILTTRAINTLSAHTTKWSNTIKQFVAKSRRIAWVCLTILWGWPLKSSMDWFLYDNGLRHERVNGFDCTSACVLLSIIIQIVLVPALLYANCFRCKIIASLQPRWLNHRNTRTYSGIRFLSNLCFLN